MAGLLILNIFTFKATREDAKLEKRAWVGVKDVIAPKPLTSSEKFRYEVYYTNTGNTPAVDVNAVYGIAVGEDVDIGSRITETENEFANISGSQFVIPPQADFLAAGSGKRKLTDSEIEGIRGGEAVIWIYGRFHYRDIFGDSHQTGYCFTYDPNTNGFNAYSEHNYID